MWQEIKLTPVELYFLGKRMGAKYIDYQYIADMPGIQDNYALHEQEVLSGLEARGLIMEDFGGEVEIEDHVREALTPVFFGKTESLVNAEQTHRFHICGEKAAHTVKDGEYIVVCTVEDSDIRQILEGIEGEATILCAKVEEGMRESTFVDMQKTEQVEKAIKFVKGEW